MNKFSKKKRITTTTTQRKNKDDRNKRLFPRLEPDIFLNDHFNSSKKKPQKTIWFFSENRTNCTPD
jgi:hypothetical protein